MTEAQREQCWIDCIIEIKLTDFGVSWTDKLDDTSVLKRRPVNVFQVTVAYMLNEELTQKSLTKAQLEKKRYLAVMYCQLQHIVSRYNYPILKHR